MGKDSRYELDGVDDGLDDGDTAVDTAPASATETTSPEPEPEPEPETESEPSTADRPDEIPHRVRHDGPKDGDRTSKTIYIEPEDDQRLGELEALAKAEFDEKVYGLDVYLAGVRAGLHSDDEAFLNEMRQMGYGYFD